MHFHPFKFFEMILLLIYIQQIIILVPLSLFSGMIKHNQELVQSFGI